MMPDGTGFDVLSSTQPDCSFEAVFVTAFEKMLMHNFNNRLPASWKLVIPGANGEEYTITLPSIEYVESHLDSGTYIQAGRPFRYYADLFAGLKFFQINNLQMVQLSSISYLAPEDGKVVLKSGTVLEITERRKKDLIVRLHSNR